MNESKTEVKNLIYFIKRERDLQCNILEIVQGVFINYNLYFTDLKSYNWLKYKSANNFYGLIPRIKIGR